MENLLAYLNSLPTTEQEAYAVRCGTSVGYLRKACSIGQRLGADLCISLDRESKGVVSRDILRPDVDWDHARSPKKRAA